MGDLTIGSWFEGRIWFCDLKNEKDVDDDGGKEEREGEDER